MSWRVIREFPMYSINEEGRIRNDNTGRILRQSINEQGILYVGLTSSQDGQQYKRSVAHMVAKTFLGKPLPIWFNTPIHLDGNRLNCRIDNLMWRPRPFAVRYHQQFDHPTRGYDAPIEEVDTGEKFRNSWFAATKYGLLNRDIVRSIVNQVPVFPTNQMFREVE